MNTIETIRAVLFDLDGTLLNTLDDLADSMNAVLERLGCPTHPMDAYRYFVGDGIVMLATRALPEQRRDESAIGECVQAMKEEYEHRWDVKTRPYDGVADMIARLNERGLPLAVLSNKVDSFTHKAVARFFPSGSFRIVRGVRDGTALKPEPAGAMEIANEFGIAPAEFLYVGDTATDMKTAVAAGMCPVGALWGFRTLEELVTSGAKHVVEHPRSVVDILGTVHHQDILNPQPGEQINEDSSLLR